MAESAERKHTITIFKCKASWLSHKDHDVTFVFGLHMEFQWKEETKNAFWENKMFPKLNKFYLQYYLPKMADLMFPTGQPIHELADNHKQLC